MPILSGKIAACQSSLNLGFDQEQEAAEDIQESNPDDNDINDNGGEGHHLQLFKNNNAP